MIDQPAHREAADALHDDADGRVEITDGLTEGDVAIMPAGGALDGDRIRIKPARGAPGPTPNLGR